MDRLDAQKLALREMNKWGLTDDGWTFGWNRGRPLGFCRHAPIMDIRLNAHFVILNHEIAVAYRDFPMLDRRLVYCYSCGG